MTLPKSLLRDPVKAGDRLVCYCPPGVCQAPRGFNGPCNRASGQGIGPSGWIDVDVRKPEKNVEVLIAFRDTPLAATGQYTASPHDTWGWSFPSENDPDDTGPVIAWQPLPEHPSPQPGWKLKAIDKAKPSTPSPAPKE